jgi:hypothetical protein
MIAARALRLSAAVLAGTAAGCAIVTATDGTRFRAHGAEHLSLAAVQASGAHDLGCPPAQVTPRWLRAELYTAEGCGLRATYQAVPDQAFYTFKAVLIACVPLDGATRIGCAGPR